MTGEAHHSAVNRRPATGLALRAWLTVWLAGIAICARAQSPTPITEGQQLTGTLGPDDSFTVSLTVERGRAYLVEVEQSNYDLEIAVDDGLGTVRRFNSPLFRNESEFVLLEPGTDGEYRITITPFEEFTHAHGDYSIVIDGLGPDRPDRGPVEVWRLMSEASAALAAEPKQADIALQLYNQAAALWSAFDDPRHRAQSLYSAGMVLYWSLNRWEDAADSADQAAAVYEQLGDERLYAQTRFLQAYSLTEVAEEPSSNGNAGPAPLVTFEAVLQLFAEALEIHERIGTQFDVANVLNFNAIAHYYRSNESRGDLDAARSLYERAATLFTEEGEWREAANVRQNLALLLYDQGYSAAAAVTFNEILDGIPDGKARFLQGVVLSNLGYAHVGGGRLDEALIAFTGALEIHRELGDFDWESDALLGLAKTYLSLGEFDRAESFAYQSLTKLRADSRVRLSVFYAMGDIAYWQGDYERALTLHQEAVSMAASDAQRAFLEVAVYKDLVALGRAEEVIAGASRLTVNDEAPEGIRAEASTELGYGFLLRGDFDLAAERFDDAQDVFERVGQHLYHAKALRGSALAASGLGDHTRAVAYGEQSIKELEKVRTNVAVPELRAYFFSQRRDYYETQIELLLASSDEGQVGAIRDALTVSERARARMTVDLLAESSVDLSSRASPEDRQRRDELLEELLVLSKTRSSALRNTTQLGATLDETSAMIVQVENQLSLLDAEIRRNDPVAANLLAPVPLDADAIQELLDDETVLLQYMLGEPASYVWAVTREDVKLVTLAAGPVIERAARQVHELLGEFGGVGMRSQIDRSLGELGNLVIAPVASEIQGRENILISGDGALNYIPFGVLPVATESGFESLVTIANVSHAPSVSVLAALQAKNEADAPEKMIAVFADPVFTADDPRFNPDGSTMAALATPASPRFERSAWDRPLVRLPASGIEARRIAELVPEDSRYIETGLGASREAIVSGDLDQYRIIHFATHGRVDTVHPAMSGLALSAQIDPNGALQQSFLSLSDIYELDLQADLVVLSACRTGLGKSIRGEGMVGLVQGFLYAGAQNLVVSLWQVPDVATAELMGYFYENMLVNNLEPADALREAQLRIASDRRWSNPFYWGAFVLIGEG